MKFLLPLLLLLLTAPAAAQRLVPLMENPRLQSGRTPQPAALMTCENPDLPGIERIVSGQNRTIRIELDTAGLGSDLTDYRCIGCDQLQFGSVELRTDTLLYTARPDVSQGLDTFGLTVCSPQGVCSDTTELVILVQRAGRTIDLGRQLLQPESRAEIVVPTDTLPGGAVCRTIAACNEEYPGRGQRFDFLTGQAEGNDFLYQAGRYGGDDAVCVTVCNEYGLCDTYRATFTIDRPAQQLPFFDDFSYDGVRPSIQRWQDNDVYINRTYSLNPPSVGVATFDAVDYDGQPYPQPGNTRSSVPRDYLTSVPLLMEGRSGSVLTFYLEPRGLGNRPELQDSFLVQFLSPEGEWNTVFAREGLPNTFGNTRLTNFTGHLVPVPDAYLYNGFQFRFVGLSTERGAVDNWNLDYVKLSDQSTSLVTQDLALVEPPFRLLAPYTSMPVRHLQAGGQELLADSIYLKLWNHRADITPVTSSSYRVESLGDPAFTSGAGLFPSAYFGQDNGIAPLSLEIRDALFEELPTYQDIRSFLFGLDPEGTYRLATTYAMQVATEDTGFSPLISANDTATQVTVLDNYFAYDDGTAELALEGQPGNVILQRYTAFVPDQLVGIRIRIPRGLGNVGSQPINLVVYGEAEAGGPGEELYTAEEPVLYAEDYYRDSLEAFTSYALDAPLELPVGNFYIGWRQAQADRSLPVGFDRNNRAPAATQYFNAGNGWEELSGATGGVIMIRPLLAGAEVMPTSTGTVPEANELVIYPNPTGGVVNIRMPNALYGRELSLRLYSGEGRLLLEKTGVDRLDLEPFPPGLYLLECRIGDRYLRHKIVRN